MFHRQDQHRILLEAATSSDGQGPPCKVIIDHVASSIDAEQGTVTFQNGSQIQADLIIGADGIRSVVREQIGVEVNKRSAPQTCYRCNVTRQEAERLGLEWANYPGIQFWGGYPIEGLSQYYKIVMSPCAGGDIISFYLFMPTELTTHQNEGFTWAEATIEDCMPGLYSVLDPKCRQLIQHSVERKPWRLYIHKPYSHWYKGKVCVLGDAAKPMVPVSLSSAQSISQALILHRLFFPAASITGRCASDRRRSSVGHHLLFQVLLHSRRDGRSAAVRSSAQAARNPRTGCFKARFGESQREDRFLQLDCA